MQMIRGALSVILTGAVLVLGLGACDDDGTGPNVITRADLVGTFDATTFTATTGGNATNLLPLGASIDVTLTSAGATTGRLFIPGEITGQGDLDADLAGTFTFNEATRTVAFQQGADTLLRDLTFTAVRAGNTIRLEGKDTFGNATVDVVLTQR